jgi:hypothetical protein
MWQTMSNHSRSWQCPPPPLRQAFAPFAVSCNYFKSLLVSVCNSLCSVTFKVLRSSWVIPSDSIFKKPHQKEVVKCREVWWSWWPSPRLIMRTPKNFCKKAVVVFTVLARLAKPETPLILFQQTSEQGQKTWIIFHSKRLFKEQWSHNSFSRHRAWNTNFDEYRGLLYSACGFSALHTVLFWPLMYPLNCNHAWSVQNKMSSTKNPSC